MIITVDEARAYVHDYETADADMVAFILTAEGLIKGGVRTDVNLKDERAKLLAKLMVGEMDNNRDMGSAKEVKSRGLLIESIILQLKNEPPVSDSDTGTTGGTTGA